MVAPFFRRHWQAFTLTELMVVIAIVAMLLALLIPAMKRAREEARIPGCMMAMRADGILKTMIGTDTRYFVPVMEAPAKAMHTFGRTFFVTRALSNVNYSWNAVMDQWAGYEPTSYYKKRPSVCPSFDNRHLVPSNMGYYASYTWTMRAPHIDYGLPPNYRRLPIRYSRIRSDALIETEGKPFKNPNDTGYYFYTFSSPYFGYDDMDYRHLGRANYLSHDGSVAGYRVTEVPVARFKLVN